MSELMLPKNSDEVRVYEFEGKIEREWRTVMKIRIRLDQWKMEAFGHKDLYDDLSFVLAAYDANEIHWMNITSKLKQEFLALQKRCEALQEQADQSGASRFYNYWMEAAKERDAAKDKIALLEYQPIDELRKKLIEANARIRFLEDLRIVRKNSLAAEREQRLVAALRVCEMALNTFQVGSFQELLLKETRQTVADALREHKGE